MSAAMNVRMFEQLVQTIADGATVETPRLIVPNESGRISISGTVTAGPMIAALGIKWLPSGESVVLLNESVPFAVNAAGDGFAADVPARSGKCIITVTGGVSIPGTKLDFGIYAMAPAALMTSGLLEAPPMTTAQRDALGNPRTGSVIFNTTTGALEAFNGTGWV